MRRSKKLRPDNFPFLAVLLCAMGALILVLMALDRRARLAAHSRIREAEESQQREQADLLAQYLARQEAEREAERQTRQERLAKHERETADLRSQQEKLRADYQRLQAEVAAAERSLAEQKKQSSDLEARRGTEEAKTAHASKEIAERQTRIEIAGRKLEAARTERQKLADLLRQLEVALARLKEQRERDKQKWSVVPYVGKRGLNSRPMYVECTAYGLVFHPDSLVVANTSNEEAVREAIRKRMERFREQTAAGQQEQPAYWMLLVRPDGIENYYRFIAAARPLEVTYGYEFIDPDWKLDFPEPATVPVAEGPAVPLRARVGGVVGTRRGSQASGEPGALATGGPRPGGQQGGGEPGALATGGPGNLRSLTLPARQAGPPVVASSGAQTPGNARGTPVPDSVAATPPHPGEPGREAGAPVRIIQPRNTADGTPGEPNGSQTAGAKATAGSVQSSSASGQTGAAGSGEPSKLAGPPDRRSEPPPPLRPAARFDDEWVMTVECTGQGVRLMPSQVFVPIAQLYSSSGGDSVLLQTVLQSLERRKAGIRAGDPPLKAYIRFVVYRDGLRAFHLAYPALVAVAAEKSTVVPSE